MKKIERLLTIVLALKHYGKMTAKELADLLEFNVRTIYRDMDALSQMNIPIVASSGADGGYEIMPHYFIPSVSLNKDEILALMIAKKLIDIVDIPGFGKHIESAFLKIQNLVEKKEREQLSSISDRVAFSLTGMIPDMKDSDYFEDIRKSFETNRTLYIDYYSPKKLKTEEREIIPHILRFYEGCWYLLSHCLSRNAERTFRLDRILSLHLTENHYDEPETFNPEKFDRVAQYKKDAGNPSGTSIIIKMSHSLYEREKDKLMFKYYPVEHKADQCLIRITTAYTEDYVRYAIKEYRESEIIKPESLRNRIKIELNNILKKYAG